MDGPFDLDGFLPYQLAVLAARTSRAFERVYRGRFGVGVAEWRVLAHLAHSGTVSVREIHARVDMDKSKVSRAASRLEARGLIGKRASREDRRLVELSLTDAGRTLVAEMTPVARAFEADMLARLGDEAPAVRAAVAQLLKQTEDLTP